MPRLTEQDYREVAEMLGVETAAIKAIVDIEAGKAHEGFWAPGKPILNFDMSMFQRFAAKKGINVSAYRRSHPGVFTRAGSMNQAGVRRRLDAARQIHPVAAIEGAFWGMFQIGGFNWSKCGAKDIHEFEALMSRSERDQLNLFAKFIETTGLTKYLKSKNWAAFARSYNGPSYARRGYHTKLASAYARHKSKERMMPSHESHATHVGINGVPVSEPEESEQ